MDSSKKRKADENGDSSSPSSALLTLDDARSLLSPLSHGHLLDILAPALLLHPDLLSAARSLADPDPSRRKLFVRGLAPETTTDTLRSLFSSYGPIDEAVVITDKNTAKSKGYGFVTFKHVDGAILALKQPSKKIDGRMTVTQLAAVGVSATGAADVAARKIYVGNVPFEISSERLLGHFSAYGEVEEGPLGFDKSMGKAKGFAFFIYKNEEGARASLVDPIKNIDGHQVTCKLAVDGGKKAVVKPVTGPNNGVDSHNRVGGLMPNSMNSSYSGPGGGGYGGFTGGQPPMMAPQNPHSNSPLPPSSGGPGFGNQGLPPYGGGGVGGFGGAFGSVGGGAGGYGGVQYGGPGSGEYGGMSNAGSYGNRAPPSSVGMPSGGYPDSGGNYGLSSSAFPAGPAQLHQPSSGPRVPPGGMYQGMPPYY